MGECGLARDEKVVVNQLEEINGIYTVVLNWALSLDQERAVVPSAFRCEEE